jgi:hypothetical protein
VQNATFMDISEFLEEFRLEKNLKIFSEALGACV